MFTQKSLYLFALCLVGFLQPTKVDACVQFHSAADLSVYLANKCGKRILINWRAGGSRKLGVDRAVLAPNKIVGFNIAGKASYTYCIVAKGVANPQICTGTQWYRVKTKHDWSNKDGCLSHVEENRGEFIYFVGVKNNCAYPVNVAVAVSGKSSSNGRTSEGLDFVRFKRKFLKKVKLQRGSSYRFPDSWPPDDDILYAACAAHPRQETYPAFTSPRSGASTCSVYDEY
ncbi:hypothetical protein [uncultured Roseovarius sp.]|uniref:hypothetical protein n=1 Tax=uncultured Roseovarius sp. TaxID=293344 RepID=UPI002620535C|nr:hypothetical protein [uncultured Roseovarius sp.]